VLSWTATHFVDSACQCYGGVQTFRGMDLQSAHLAGAWLHFRLPLLQKNDLSVIAGAGRAFSTNSYLSP
jgi:hypothetical protein